MDLSAPSQDQQPKAAQETVEAPEWESSFVKHWEQETTAAKSHWDKDFERMRKNMEFVTGYQWEGQAVLDDPRYSNNLVLRLVNQKVAQLYAKNPTVEVKRREQMDFQVWDGSIEQLTEATMALAMGQPNLPAMVLLQDYMQGKQRQQMIDRFAKTVQKLLQYFLDAGDTNIKEPLKQAVRRAIICGCAPGRVIYHSQQDPQPVVSHDGPSAEAQAVASRATTLVAKMEKDGTESDTKDSRLGQLTSYAKSLAASLGAQMSGTDAEPLPERIEFDFPMATSVFPDKACRSLTNLSGANWLCIESMLPLDFVNSLFGTEVTADKAEGATLYGKNQEEIRNEGNEKDNLKKKGDVCVREIMDLETRTHFFICKGWKKLLLAPEPFRPPVNGFWPACFLTFNSVEVEPSTKASIYPPSDVQVAKSIQKEWNRMGNALRDHRLANAPTMVVRKGTLSDADKDALNSREPNQVIELDSIPADKKVSDFIEVLKPAPIDPAVYEKGTLEKDLQYSAGMQEANIGPAKSNVTATVGSIAEQSRLTVTASNVDDLDGFLTNLVRMAGEMCVRAMSEETVKFIVGPGAVWPTTAEARHQMLHAVDITIRAASSGRPNKALEVQNAKELGPLLLQAIQASAANPLAAKPLFALVEEIARRLDDQIDITKFAPVPQPPPQPGQPQAQPQPSRAPASANRTRNGNHVPRGPSGPGAQNNTPQMPVMRQPLMLS